MCCLRYVLFLCVCVCAVVADVVDCWCCLFVPVVFVCCLFGFRVCSFLVFACLSLCVCVCVCCVELLVWYVLWFTVFVVYVSCYFIVCFIVFVCFLVSMRCF